MSRFKKGNLIKLPYDNRNVYMLIEELEHNVFVLIRIKRKDGRFDIKRRVIRNIEKDYILEESKLNLDKRDQEIYNEFKEYVINNKFKTEFKVYEYTYTHFKPKLTIRNYLNLYLNINLSKYKKYSNKL